jgi:hypothetical protein
VFRELLAVRDLGIVFLDAAGVREHDAAEILRSGRAKHPPREALRNQSGQISAVVEMGVRQHNRVDL